MKLPAGYLLPEGTTMADVRQIDLELLASEGIEIETPKPEQGTDKSRPSDDD